MRPTSKLVSLAIVLFLASLPLIAVPGLGEMINAARPFSGFDCLRISLRALVFVERGDFGAYVFGFGVVNVAFFAISGAQLCGWRRFRRTRLWAVIASMAYVVSWWVWLATNAWRSSQRLEVGIAYYLWLAAFVVLLLAHIRSEKKTAEPGATDNPDDAQ